MIASHITEDNHNRNSTVDSKRADIHMDCKLDNSHGSDHNSQVEPELGHNQAFVAAVCYAKSWALVLVVVACNPLRFRRYLAVEEAEQVGAPIQPHIHLDHNPVGKDRQDSQSMAEAWAPWEGSCMD